MTVQTETSRSGPYAGSGTTGPFTVGFRFLDNTHLQVIRTSSAGVDTTLVITTDYSVSGAGGSSGTVTLVSALASGERLTIIRDVPFTQLADYVDNDAFPAESHENALDLLTMQTQQNREVLDRSLTLPATTSGVSTELPVPESNKLIGWNETADALQNIDSGTLATIVAYGTASGDIFSGTGVQTVFTLGANPGALYNLDVSIGGVDQRPTLDYTWSAGTDLTFVVAPVAGTNNISVKYKQALPQGTADAAAVSYLPAGTGAVATNVQAKLRESVSVKDFGAVGDGVTDDTAAIQAAINALDNHMTLSFGGAKSYKTTTTLVFPNNLVGVVIQGCGAIILCQHNQDGIVMTSVNENFSRYSVYDLTVRGPNVKYPANPAQLAGTSTGYGIKIGPDDTTNTPGGYKLKFYNVTVEQFQNGLYLQNVLLSSFHACTFGFNANAGLYVDSGQTNANSFYMCAFTNNRTFGIYSSPRAGGALTYATSNNFFGCEFETNIPYDESAGGYPTAFNPAIGIACKLWNSYEWVFSGCYWENHNYSVMFSGSSDGNKFRDSRFDGGGGTALGPSAGVQLRPGGIYFDGTTLNGNMFSGCSMISGSNTYENVGFSSPLGNSGNQFQDNFGFILPYTSVSAISPTTYIRNNNYNAYFAPLGGINHGMIQMPPQGYVENIGAGSTPGKLDGIGTAAATLYSYGCGEILFGNQITGATTITSISGGQQGQVLVLRNYQDVYPITLKNGVNGTSELVLRSDAVLTEFGQQIVLYVTSGSVPGGTGNRYYEIGRNFEAPVSWTPVFTTSGGSLPAQSVTGRYIQNGKRIDFWFSCTFTGGPITDPYYTTDFQFQHFDTFRNVGTAENASNNGLFSIQAITSSRLRVYVTSAVSTFSGFGTVLTA